MGKLSPKLRNWAGDGSTGLIFWCPGCGESHSIRLTPDGWGWDGNVDLPTFTPSILVRGGHFMPDKEGKFPARCWCTFKAEGGETNFACKQCHSFVTNGNILFLGDCSHALAGKTVPLPDIPD